MALEINLVPDIKNEMIKTLKLRNFILFLCIIVASASVFVVFIFGAICGGQQIAIDNKKSLLDNYSKKVNSYTELNEFLTIKDQVGNIASITSEKRLASRTFNVLSALIPTNSPDTIEISELKINLAEDKPTYTIEAQANAGKDPYIDYNVLDAFKKSMQYMRYDYGNYVDREGNIIPAYCMIEKDSNGASFTDPDSKAHYAYWTITAENCNPKKEKEASSDNKSDDSSETDTNEEAKNEENKSDEEAESIDGYTLEEYDGRKVVKIWRTPQFNDWYEKGYMDLDGKISKIEHFESACTTYSGEKNANNSKIKWKDQNDSCLLIPDGVDGISILESSNGRNSSEELVLRFSAVITLDPEVYNFNNTHMVALGPPERRNVTDSYVQIQSIFAERARDCQEGDTACEKKGEN